jgi:hypothetical protein
VTTGATGVSRLIYSLYRVAFAVDVSACTATATLAAVKVGTSVEQPVAGRITVGSDGGQVLVKTYGADGSPAEQPFNVIVGC